MYRELKLTWPRWKMVMWEGFSEILDLSYFHSVMQGQPFISSSQSITEAENGNGEEDKE